MQKDYTIHITRLTEESVRTVKDLEIEAGLSPWSVDDYLAEIERSDSIIATANTNDHVIGFISARFVGCDTKNGNACEVEIYNIAVKKDFRGINVGKALLEFLLLDPRVLIASRLWLEVRESNEIAIKFYEKNGFVPAYVRKNFYASPIENAIVMKRPLPLIQWE